jgi:polysaccharide biosynthesis transport protein
VDSELQQMRQGTPGMLLTSSGAAAIQSAQSRINQAELALAQARTIYTDKHPEIDRLNDELTRAKADHAAARKAAPANLEEMLEADPIYRAKVNERNAIRSRIRTLQMAESNARAQITRYQSAVAAAPRVEQEMASLDREVKLENARYSDLKKKHEEAIVAESMSRTQGGERFSILYAAGLPTVPESPNVLQLLMMSFGLGLALAVGLVLAREFVDRSVHDARALQNEFELPVLGEIPKIQVVA